MNDNYHIRIGIERPEGQQPGDARDMNALRREIQKAMRDSTLIGNVMYAADCEGLNAEDRYTLLAYEALVALETYWKQLIRQNMLNPMPRYITQNDARCQQISGQIEAEQTALDRGGEHE
jgi:hypothetical protein